MKKFALLYCTIFGPYQFYMKKLFEKLNQYYKQAGYKVTYIVLLLFYAYRNAETPSWAKRIILGAIIYFISPIDAIPDLSPLIGYTDDVGLLGYGLVSISVYINDEVKINARKRFWKYYPSIPLEKLVRIDNRY